jgi:hypothetical protein
MRAAVVRSTDQIARPFRRRLFAAVVAICAVVLPFASVRPAIASESAAPSRFNPMTYNWSKLGHRRPARAVKNSQVILRGDNTVTAGLNTAASGALVAVDGGYDTTVTDSVLGGMFRVYSNRLPHVRGVLEFSDVFSTSTKAGNGVVGASFVAQFNDITASNDGITPTGEAAHQTVIQYNNIHRDGTTLGSSHHDGIQFWQNGNAVIRRNWISGWTTSAILIKSDLSPISHITIDENYLANPTGYFAVYVRDGGHGRPTFIDITNNAFGWRATPLSSGANAASEATFARSAAVRQTAIDAGNTSAAAWIVWSGNYYADGPKRGKPVPPPGRWSDGGR